MMNSSFRVIPAVLLLCVLAMPSVATAQKQSKERGVKVNVKQAGAPRFKGKVYDNLWAVVVGVDAYKHWPRLDYAVNDAKSVRELLVSKYGFRSECVMELLNEEATLVNLRTTLGGVLPQKTKKNDGVFIFFAGHGETVELPDGGNLGYLVPWDGSTAKGDYFATLMPMTQIRELCAMIPAKHIFFVVDACYSGLAAVSERGLSAETEQYIGKLANLRSRQILTAGGKGEQVMENDEWGHSAFTYKLLEGLENGASDADGDGVITSGEIAQYIKSRVPRITNNHQTPQFKNLTADEGEFIFISPAAPPREDTQQRDVDPSKTKTKDGKDEQHSMKAELERLKRENERLKEEQKQQKPAPKKEEKKNDEPFSPPP
jgi:hypothetical protein